MTRAEEKYTTLDTEQCKWWVNHLFNMAKEKACNSHNFDDAQEMQSAQDKIIKALEFIDKMHKLKTDYNNYKISQDERIKEEVELFKEVGI